MTREPDVVDKFRDYINKAIKEGEEEFLFHGLKLDTRREYKIGGRSADLVVLRAGKPILIVEAKGGGADPHSEAAVGQALCYAYIYAKEKGEQKTPLFATLGPDLVVVYKPIEVEKAKEIVDINKCIERNYEDAIKNFTLLQSYKLDKYEINESEAKRLLEDVTREVKGYGTMQPETFEQLVKDLKEFVESTSKNFVKGALEIALNDKNFKEKLDKLAKESGYESLDALIGKNREHLDRLSKMMVYVLLNKILFYKILSNTYKLPELTPIGGHCRLLGEDVKSIDDYLKCLNVYFNEALRKTKDFEAIFITGLYDEIRMFDDKDAMEKIDEIIEELHKIDTEDFRIAVGYIYDSLLDSSERHALGQFYTPPAIARLITNWAIRSPDDKVLDPGCGSGTFLTYAYERLAALKTGKKYPRKEAHAKILDQIYGVDINAFAAHLASMHLAIKNPYSPSTNINIVNKDYFEIIPGQTVLSPYAIMTPRGEERRKIAFNAFDAVIGNPPYTRWTELGKQTRDAIKRRLGDLLKEYVLMPNVGVGKEVPIYVYWIMHSTGFLKEGGRLGMIISKMWLSTDYGIRFGNFLLDHYRIVALIDFPMRLFDALIKTVILLAEKESDKSKRENNVVTLIRISPKIQDVEGALNCIEGSFNPDGSLDKNKLDKCRKEYEIDYRIIKQSEIPRDRKWRGLFFGIDDIINKLITNKNIVKLEEYFIPSRGNSIWGIWAIHNRKRPDLGANDFFYFDESEAKRWFGGNMDCLVPAITEAEEINTFKFTKEDWEKLKEKDKDVYIFVCHRRRADLPDRVKEYIKWGESERCKTKIRGTRGGGKKCNEAEACKAREKIDLFYGWYDLGGYVPTPIMAIRKSNYHPQFFLCEMPLVTYDSIITLIPKMPVKTNFMVYDPVKDFLEKMPKREREAFDIKTDLSLDEKEIKALLAYMNSTFIWLWLESWATQTSGGVLGLESSVLEEMPLLDVKRIDRKYVEELAQLFDKLEERARQLQGKTKKTMFMELGPIFRKIDSKINEVLNLGEDVDRLWDLAVEMMESRIEGTEEVSRPGNMGLGRKKEERKQKEGGSSGVPLDKFM